MNKWLNVDGWVLLLIECLKCMFCGFKDESFMIFWFCL